jgi:hypothetical protein
MLYISLVYPPVRVAIKTRERTPDNASGHGGRLVIVSCMLLEAAWSPKIAVANISRLIG